MLELMARGGMRAGEVLNLTPADIQAIVPDETLAPGLVGLQRTDRWLYLYTILSGCRACRPVTRTP